MTERIVTIKAGREKSIVRQHPWIFSGAIEKAKGAVPGELVTVVDTKGNFLARGYWNPRSQIQVRILTWQDEPIDDVWWRRMLKRAIDARKNHQFAAEGLRLINAENDFIPGLIVDRYGEWIVLQALTLYIDTQKNYITELLVDVLKIYDLPVQGVYERSDVDVRGKEGLKFSTGVIWGIEPPELIYLGTESLIYGVDVRKGHKTGAYLDQKHNHHLLTDEVLDADTEQTLLNLFSYTGRFGLAFAGHVTNVDSSHDMLELAKQNYERCLFKEDEVDFVQADCFDYLHEAVKEGKQFDVVILDPPKFAHNAGQVDKAARGYKDLNLNAFKIIKPGGYLMTFSCSGAISQDLFQKIVFGALADSGRQAQIVKHLSASDDHPIALTFPEGEYLKGLLLRVY
jgi:23S rRNA (cytosine1962-C5)-methyltransferase